MCFSANASFTASALLLLSGIVTVSKVTLWRTYLFAAIPLLFSIQQAIEGVLWIALRQNIVWLQQLTMYGFLAFAFVIWPIWIPTAVRLMELKGKRNAKMILNFCILLGIGIAAYFIALFIIGTTQVQAEQNHIVYSFSTPLFQLIPSALLYAVATIIPFFISERLLMRLFGIVLLASYLIAWALYEYAFISVWCFFTAILSIVVYATV